MKKILENYDISITVLGFVIALSGFLWLVLSMFPTMIWAKEHNTIIVGITGIGVVLTSIGTWTIFFRRRKKRIE